MKRTILITAVIILCFVGAIGCKNNSEVQQAQIPQELLSLQGLDFDQFISDSFIILLERDPETVTELGLDSQLGMSGDQLTSLDPDYIAYTQSLESGIFEMLQNYNRASLTSKQQIVYDAYYWYLDDMVRGQAFTYDDYPINMIVWSVDQYITQFFSDIIPVTNKQEAQNYITRLGQVKTKFDQLLEGLRIREQNGVIIPRMYISWFLPNLENVAFAIPRATVFYSSFMEKLGSITELTSSEKQDLLQQAEEAINTSVIPAFQELVDYFSQIRSSAPSEIGIGGTPHSQEAYAYFLRDHSTSDLTPEEVHQMGLNALEEIHARMYEIFDQLGYPTDLGLVPLYQQVAAAGGTLNGQEIYDEYVRLIEYAKESTADLFDMVPNVDVIIKADPMGGFYNPPALDGSRPGMFYAQVNGSMYKYLMPDLTFHETIPGHHYQFGIMSQLDIPLFQKVINPDGYAEGWALYAERLMWENGAYKDDPYGELGYLRYQALRAARMVIDTGVNSMGWTFDQAVTFLMDNTGIDKDNSQFEVARASVIPGQSSSYYIGYQTILQLRQEMQDALGSDFDIKAFHDLILENGPLPLTVLKSVVEQKIAELTK